MITDEEIQEFESLDQNDLFSSNNDIDEIQLYDLTVEVIGYVDGIESPKRVGSDQQYSVFKFYLNNNNGKRIQIMAWNDLIDEVVHKIQCNFIVHLDGAQARPPKLSRFNNGTVPFELQVQTNTVISILGKYEPIQMSNETAQLVQLNEVMNTHKRIMIEAFIKTQFQPVHDPRLNKQIGCGAVTDGTYKLEIHIINFNVDSYLDLTLRKGDKIRISGIMQTTVEPSFLSLNSVDDIKKLDGHMSLATVLKGNRTIKKRKREDDETC